MRKQEVLRFIEKLQRNTPSELSAKDDEEMFKIHTRLEVLKELHKAFEEGQKTVYPKEVLVLKELLEAHEDYFSTYYLSNLDGELTAMERWRAAKKAAKELIEKSGFSPTSKSGFQPDQNGKK